MKRFLFQGDSITDAGRRSENIRSMGEGYATAVSAMLASGYPGEYEFINKGSGGDRITDVYVRIKSDIINLKPDYMSILIGINDVWHELDYKNGVDAAKSEKIYSMLIEEVKEALPEIKIIVLAPFVTAGRSTNERLEEFQKGAKERAEIAERIAKKYGLEFVTLQDKFDAMIEKTSAEYCTEDGVHPTPAGHGIIARALIEKFEEIR